METRVGEPHKGAFVGVHFPEQDSQQDAPPLQVHAAAAHPNSSVVSDDEIGWPPDRPAFA
jgi:hypothetical protein